MYHSTLVPKVNCAPRQSSLVVSTPLTKVSSSKNNDENSLYHDYRPYSIANYARRFIRDQRSARTREDSRCLRLMSHYRARVSDKRNDPTIGGSSRWVCFLVCRHSSPTPRGLLCKGSISGSDPISHRSIRPNCLAPPTRVGLDQTQAGCRSGLQERCSFSGRPGVFG